ncbi:MAG: hypothetical protein Q9169_006529 [Polycauliona sp. 2 TL-2023]
MEQEDSSKHISLLTPIDHTSPQSSTDHSLTTSKTKQRIVDRETAAAKRRCVSTACIACRKRKSKCDGNTPSCAACASVYGTECVYDPNSDHRRKGVYKKDIDNLKTHNSTLQTLIQAILNYPEHEVPELIRHIRTCESLDAVAESIISKGQHLDGEEPDSPIADNEPLVGVPRFEKELSGKMGELRLENGSTSFVGGTSNLVFLGVGNNHPGKEMVEPYPQQANPIVSWTKVTDDYDLIVHLLNMYFTWHYTYFTTLSKSLFYRDFLLGMPPPGTRRTTEYCTPLLVNAMLALGCHFTSWPAARANELVSATAGDHFAKEAKRLLMENDEHESPRLATVQALALMSVREAGCGREARGWVYSGMSFRMAYDLGLNVDSGLLSMDEEETDARRMSLWGCFLFDKCWSNYLGRQPQVPLSSVAVPKFDVFPIEDSETWSPYSDAGVGQNHSQPARTRAVALQISSLCEISGDLLHYFYHPTNLDKPLTKQAELRKLSELHTRLEAWRKDLPKELEPKEGQLACVLVMHMFYQLLFIHLFRPFLKYRPSTSPLPSHVSPRKFCTHSATTISKLLRLYKRTYGLRQIVNLAVYIAHTACTIHLLNLPDKNAVRDIIHGLKHLEEIADGWLCARKTLRIISIVASKWKIDLPEEAMKLLERTDSKYAAFSPTEHMSPIQVPLSTDDVSRAPLNQSVNGVDGSNSYLDSAETTSPTEATRPYGSMSLPPSSASELNPRSRPQQYGLPQAQQEMWNRDRASRGAVAQNQTSPSVLFGGVDSLIEDSQDYWLQRDTGNLLAHWTGVEGQDGNDQQTPTSLHSTLRHPRRITRITNPTTSQTAVQPPAMRALAVPFTTTSSPTMQTLNPLPASSKAISTMTQPPTPTSPPLSNTTRIRDNQRRSRARRKEYTLELEAKVREYEKEGAGASAEMQAAARRVVGENEGLREEVRRLRGEVEMLRRERGGQCREGEGGGEGGGKEDSGNKGLEEGRYREEDKERREAEGPVFGQGKRKRDGNKEGDGGGCTKMPKRKNPSVSEQESPCPQNQHRSISTTILQQQHATTPPSPASSSLTFTFPSIRSTAYPGTAYPSPPTPPQYKHLHNQYPPLPSPSYPLHPFSSEPHPPLQPSSLPASNLQSEIHPPLLPPESRLSDETNPTDTTDPDTSSCHLAAQIITSMRSDLSCEQVREELGCKEREECKVGNSRLLDLMGRFT